MSGFTDFGSHQGGVISGTCVPFLRYYGWYSNKARGMRAKDACSELVESENFANVDIEIPEEKDTLDRKLARSRWASLIKRVYEVDPLLCPHCGKEMRVIAFIEKRDQFDVIERILKHCNLWREPVSRAPPKFTLEPACTELAEREYVPMDEFLANF